jgi:carbonic anhydrase
MNPTLMAMLRGNTEHAREFDARFDGLEHAQQPEAVTVCCSDSRVLKDHAWGNDEPGRVFTCANIGNRVVQRTAAGEVVSGDVLYPLEHAGTELAVVLGHTGCGAVTAAYDDLTEELSEPPGIAHCLSLLRPRLEPGVEALPDGLDRGEAVNRLVEYNVDRQVEFLLDSDDLPDGVDVAGAVYDFQTAYGGRRGEVHLVNVDGETDVETLRATHSGVADRIHRLWEY